ncbi:microcin-processing peptidase 2. Unknown type peptidase. MEROPS family U62 [Desulfonispora thiosulfatigenes DSM 11270]|uniref:TldD protein n=1 Tax=Desulfonispora thiosulfatigenes DSM 11270 TaxID=656914 RepID=A0A1W1VN95_DESTI|nr:TldD/PmbA family protein [Desulfonispora thiosulfatigenes]SMB94753.1 microcin-processing peptidase 2. Unknown type peptidase. MEROPS family U62 [Desulfonispora thiosulfatigenes DSM 11270]
MDKKLLKEILDVSLSKGADFAEIFIEEKQTTGISCEEKKIERINSGMDIGAGIRVIAGESTAYTFTNELTKEKLLEIAEVASKVAKGSKKNTSLDFTVPSPVVEFDIEIRPDQVNIDDKVDKIKICDSACRSVDEKIKQVSVGYGDVLQKVTIANSNGVFVEDERIRTRFVCNAIANDGKSIQTGFSSLGGTRGFEIFKHNDPKDLGVEAANRAVLMLSAEGSPSGKMPIVMAAEAGGTMVHEACGHGLEADLVQKGLSVYANKKGEKVASSAVTVVDDATIAHKYGSYRYDDEGNKGQKNVLIKDGILENYMYDYLTATKDKRESTGNGRRQSYQERPIPRMTNTYIAKGNDDPEKIVKSTKHGLFVKKMGGGQVNTTNGDYVFDVAEGYLIENGEITKPVKGATLTGNGPETLQMIEMVGNDLGYAIGTCGKEGQGVPVSDAQPTMKIKELIVGGTLAATDKQISRDFKIKRI